MKPDGTSSSRDKRFNNDSSKKKGDSELDPQAKERNRLYPKRRTVRDLER